MRRPLRPPGGSARAVRLARGFGNVEGKLFGAAGEARGGPTEGVAVGSERHPHSGRHAWGSWHPLAGPWPCTRTSVRLT